MSGATYKIVRFYADSRTSSVLERGLTLKQAQTHCKNPETSSTTAKSPDALKHTAKYGPWFDGYEEDESKRGAR